MSIFNEPELARRASCRLRPVSGEPFGSLEYASFETATWGLLTRFKGAVPSAEDLRARYLFHWHNEWADRPRTGTAYNTGLRKAISVAAILRRFLLAHECIRPLEPYKLDLSAGTIVGKTAIVARTRVKAPPVPLVLDLLWTRPRGPQIKAPGYVALARWLAGRELYDSTGLGLVHLPLHWGEAWSEKFVIESLARAYVDSILRQAQLMAIPVPGSYCRDCPAPCREVFRG